MTVFAGGEMTLGHLFRDIGELAGRQRLEQIDRPQELADPHDIGHDPTVDHVNEAVGGLDDAVIVGDYDDGRAVLDGHRLQ